jgi:putative ABC transport system permease protein
MIQDVRLGIRSLAKQPGFTAIGILTLALGIGATSAVFSLIQGVLLTPPPYRQPEQLALVQSVRADGRTLDNAQNWAPAQWMDWQKNVRSLEGVAAYGWSFAYLVRADGSLSMEGMYVTRDYFHVMGLEPVLGRTFTDSDTVEGHESVIILGYEYWQRQFGGDRAVLGKTLRLSRRDAPCHIVGIMPAGVRFLPSPGASQEPNYNVNATVDYFLPLAAGPKQMKSRSFDVVARVKAGVSPAAAQSEMKAAVTREAQAEPDFQGFAPQLESLGDEMNRDGSRILLPLLGAAALVLLIACGNAAALLLVRGLQRQGEYAVRTALGVSRVALFRQASVESLLLALTGGALGVGLAFAVVRAFKTIGGHAIPRLDSVTMGWPVLLFAMASAALAAVLAGLYPALRASRMDPLEALKSAGPKSSASRGERRLLRAVTMGQTALTMALLVGAALLIRTMINISNVRAGYNMDRILTMSVTEMEYTRWMDFHRRALDRVSAIPGVKYAAFAWGVPLSGNSWPWTVEIEGQPPAQRDSDRPAIPVRAVTEDYFKALDIPVLDGRELRSTDDGKQLTAAVVNQAFADRYFPGAKAIGRKIWMRGRDKPPVDIVGLAANTRTGDLTKAPAPEIYVSLWQANAFSKTLVVRTSADPAILRTAVERELRGVDASSSVENVKTFAQIRADSLASRDFAMQLLAGFAALASLLTLVGIYGVLSLSVASRRREIAIRAAVGAARGDIRSLVFGEGFRLIAAGVALGIAASFLLSRALRSFLYGVEAADPAALAAAAALFAAVALAACWGPTRRAEKVDPAEALRYE